MIHALIWTIVLTLIVGGMGFGALWLDYRQQRRDRIEDLFEQIAWDLEHATILLGRALTPSLTRAAIAFEAFAQAQNKVQREAAKRGWMFDDESQKW